jgi:hypothetical protein
VCDAIVRENLRGRFWADRAILIPYKSRGQAFLNQFSGFLKDDTDGSKPQAIQKSRRGIWIQHTKRREARAI